MDKLVLPTFYPYPLAPGETPLEAIGRWVATEQAVKELAGDRRFYAEFVL